MRLLFWHSNLVFIGLALQFLRLGPQWEHSMEHGPCSAARSSAAGGKTVWHTADIGGNWCHSQSGRNYLLINSLVYAPLILCRSVKDNAPSLWLPRGSLHTIVTGSPHKKHFTRRRKLTALLWKSRRGSGGCHVNLFMRKVIQQQVLLTHPPFLFMHKGLFLNQEENSKVCLWLPSRHYRRRVTLSHLMMNLWSKEGLKDNYAWWVFTCGARFCTSIVAVVHFCTDDFCTSVARFDFFSMMTEPVK